MLDEFLLAVPNIVAAAVIVLLAWFIGRFVAQLVARLLANLGFDRLPERIGLGHAFAAPAAGVAGELDAPAGVGTSPSATAPGLTLSDLVGKIALFFIMLFATVEAAAMLGFAGVNELLEMFIAFGADILLGLVIFVDGYWLADLAARAIERAIIILPKDLGVEARLERPVRGRSEEHTSELQSLMRISYAVFCLKKKKH